MRPRDIVDIKPKDFRSVVACLGGYLAELLKVIQELSPGLGWYAADVGMNGLGQISGRDSLPILIGDTGELAKVAQRVDQFLCGVFAVVPAKIPQPVFRAGGLWTEDEVEANLGDAVVALRAFDTACWSIATASPNLASSIYERFLQRWD